MDWNRDSQLKDPSLSGHKIGQRLCYRPINSVGKDKSTGTIKLDQYWTLFTINSSRWITELKETKEMEEQLEDNRVWGVGDKSKKPQKVLTIKEKTDEADYT